LNARIAELTATLTELSGQLDRMQAELDSQRQAAADAKLDAARLRANLKQLQSQPPSTSNAKQAAALREEIRVKDEELEKLSTELADRETNLQRERARVQALQAAIDELRRQVIRTPPPPDVHVDATALGLGANFALIIANARYRDPSYKPLPSVEKDETAIESVLHRYGFKDHITVVKDGTVESIMRAVADFSKQLGEKDSAIIYYTGRGATVASNSTSYWLPSDAYPSAPASWVSMTWLTEMIGQMRALHILVVVDSCYAGALVHTANFRMVARSAAQESERIRTLAALPSRTVLTSGRCEPVAGSTPGGNSVFASHLTEILQKNTKVLDASALYDSLTEAMRISSPPGALQLPRYSILANTNHLNGDFLFVPK
jgi:uncharacterized caspase-like protein